MPQEPPDPGIVQLFLDDLNNYTWRDNHLVEPLSGAARYLGVVPSRTWAIGQWAVQPAAGYTLSEETYNALRTGLADGDGSYTASRVRYWLARQDGVATPVRA